MSPCSASFLDDINANLEYLPLGNSQSDWIHVTDWNNAVMIIGDAPISARIISWGTDSRGKNQRMREIMITNMGDFT